MNDTARLPTGRPPPGRLVWLDGLRLVAGLSMVLLHASSDPQGQPFPDHPAQQRILPMLLRAVVYTARTELFLVISLFLLLMALERRPKSYADTLRIQARRLLIPFAFWTVFFAVYNLLKAQSFGYLDSALDQLASPRAWVGFALLGDVKYHMHFIPTLFALVLAFPLYRMAVRRPALGLLVLVCLLLRYELDARLYATFWGQEMLPWLIRGVKLLTYLGYGMVAGALLGLWRTTPAETRAALVPPVILCGGLLFVVKLAATWQTIETGAWPFDHLPGYWADFLMPVVLFATAMCLADRRWPALLSRLAPYSFGIYLCHPVFLDLVEIALRGTDPSPTLQVALKSAGGLAGAAAAAWLLGRSRALGWTIGLGPLPPPLAFKPVVTPKGAS